MSVIPLELSKLRGRQLASARLAIHCHEGIDHLDAPLTVWLRFSGLAAIAFRCGSDGATLLVGTDEQEEFSMGRHGEVRLIDGEDHEAIGGCLGRRIEAAGSIRDDLDPTVAIGVRLRFDAGLDLFIVNWGDELHLSSSPPWKATDGASFVQTPAS